MKTYTISELTSEQLQNLCKRTALNFDTVMPTVEKILAQVKSEDDSALRELTEKLDGPRLNSLVVSSQEINDACTRVKPEIQAAFKQAAENIKKFHALQLTERRTVETMPGVTCFDEMRPIDSVGLYIPGGIAPLPSTVLMLAIPAMLAGCKNIVMASPPSKEGTIPDVILYAAKLCGVKTIYKLGGAQAIAAMAYGSESVKRVGKIFGPGNQYVTAAKMLVSIDPEGAAIDMPAGPTEVLVVADVQARADFVASDLLSQAEHGPDSEVVLVCTDQSKAQEILNEVEMQLASLPRKEIADKALANSFVLIVDSVDQALVFSNDFAPEHLILNVENADTVLDQVINAGSVFIGPYSCESAGDYASGTNHSLPTYGYARVYGGVSVASFQKHITFQKVTAEGAKNIGPTVSTMAEVESLEAHKRAMEIRL